MFCKKAVLKNFTKLTENHLCQSLLLNKVADLSPATLFKKRLWHRYFHVNFTKFLRTPFFYRTRLGDCFNMQCFPSLVDTTLHRLFCWEKFSVNYFYKLNIEDDNFTNYHHLFESNFKELNLRKLCHKTVLIKCILTLNNWR